MINKYIELETKDCFILAFIAAATGHAIVAFIFVVSMLISSYNDRKKINPLIETNNGHKK